MLAGEGVQLVSDSTFAQVLAPWEVHAPEPRRGAQVQPLIFYFVFCCGGIQEELPVRRLRAGI